MMDETLIRAELKKHNYNVAKTAQALGLRFEDVRGNYARVVIPKGPIPGDISTLGKSPIERYVVAVKAHTGEWPQRFFNDIQAARRKYDQGTHEMCQEKRPDGWIVLYCIPRRLPVKRAPYFFAYRI